jgi:hypothetical protein
MKRDAKPVTSWWVSVPREDFAEKAKAEAARMVGSAGAREVTTYRIDVKRRIYGERVRMKGA